MTSVTLSSSRAKKIFLLRNKETEAIFDIRNRDLSWQFVFDSDTFVSISPKSHSLNFGKRILFIVLELRRFL